MQHAVIELYSRLSSPDICPPTVDQSLRLKICKTRKVKGLSFYGRNSYFLSRYYHDSNLIVFYRQKLPIEVFNWINTVCGIPLVGFFEDHTKSIGSQSCRASRFIELLRNLIEHIRSTPTSHFIFTCYSVQDLEYSWDTLLALKDIPYQ